MTSQMLRKLLAATDETAAASVSASFKSKKRKLTIASAAAEKTTTPVSEQDAVEWHVQTMLAADRTFDARGPNGSKSNKVAMGHALRRLEKSNKAKSKASMEAPSVLGGSRTTAMQANMVHEPTFSKSRREKIQRDRKEKKLTNLAKALKKLEKPKKKKSKSS